MQSKKANFAPGAAILTNLTEQHCLSLRFDWCRHLANWTKHTRRLWFSPIRSIVWKHDVIHKTGSTGSQFMSIFDKESDRTDPTQPWESEKIRPDSTLPNPFQLNPTHGLTRPMTLRETEWCIVFFDERQIFTGSRFELVDSVLVWLVFLSPALLFQVLDVLSLVQRAAQARFPSYVVRFVDTFTIASSLHRPFLESHRFNSL